VVPSYDGLELPWSVGCLQQLLAESPGALRWPEVAHKEALSPLLWCLVVDELIAGLNEGGIDAQGYADDVFWLWENSRIVSGLIQWTLLSVETWCDEHGLSFNPDKNGLVAFTRRRKLPGFFKPRLYGTTLRCSHDD
jgi:hypothetical protein